jgi:phosphatidate cytidylyltransferase
MAMNNFTQRALFGSVYVAVMTAAALAGGWWFLLLCLVLALLCLQELYGLAMPGRKPLFRWLLVALALPHFAVNALSEWVYMEQTSFPGSATLQQFLLFWEYGPGRFSYLLVFLVLLFSPRTRDLLREAGVFALSLLYIAWPLSELSKWNEVLVLFVFILTWSSDTFAYLAGKAFGKHKLFERVSPGKTWEGFAGGLLGTVLVAWIYAYVQDLDMRFVYILAPAAHIAGTLGDLSESLLKRNLGVKDSGQVIPGHGGILDRLDAMLFVIPVTWFLLQFFQIPYLP